MGINSSIRGSVCSLIGPDHREVSYTRSPLHQYSWLHAISHSLDMRTHQKQMMIGRVSVADTVSTPQSPS